MATSIAELALGLAPLCLALVLIPSRGSGSSCAWLGTNRGGCLLSMWVAIVSSKEVRMEKIVAIHLVKTGSVIWGIIQMPADVLDHINDQIGGLDSSKSGHDDVGLCVCVEIN